MTNKEKQEKLEEIKKLEKCIFIEKMADFMDFKAVRRMEREKAELEAELGIVHKPRELTPEEIKRNEEIIRKEREFHERWINNIVNGL